MNCPYCHKEVYGMTGLQEILAFNKHLRKCRKNPNNVVLSDGRKTVVTPTRPENIMDALKVAERKRTMKHCIHCKHIVLAENVAMSQCSVRQKNTTADYRNWLVTGGAEPANLVFCSTARGESGHCGPEAKLFEAK